MNRQEEHMVKIVEKIHKQSKELTKRMWRVLKPWINREIQYLKRLNPEKFGKFTKEDWIRYIRYNFSPEWCAIIDKNYNLRAQRYGFSGENMFFSKLVRCVSPKPYSIGDVHYHPVYKIHPSVTDLVSWANRYLCGEHIFCIHTDYGTVCYFFSKGLEKEIPKELRSFALALFGYPRSIRKKIHSWFTKMIHEKKIKVIKYER